MTERRRPRRVVLAIVLAAALLGACAGDDGDDAAGGDGGGGDDRVVIAASSEIASSDPQGANGQSYWAVVMNFGNVSEGLVELDGTSPEVQPVLAESWENPEPTTLRLHLREGVTFHDGEAFDAEVAVANIERVMDETTASAIVDFFSSVTAVSAPDDLTVDIETESPDPTLITKLTALMMLSPNDLGSPDDLGSDYAGTGPYQWADSSADALVVERFDDYWRDVDGPSEVEIRAVPEASSRVTALQAGEVDIAWDIPPEQVESVPQIVAEPVLDQVSYRLNALGGLTADQRVRDAMIMGVDVESIRTSLLGEFSDPIDGQPVGPDIFGYNPDVEAVPYDPDGARALLEEAGVVGETVELVTTDRYPRSNDFSQAMAQQLEDLGLQVELDVRDLQGWLDVLYAQEGSEVEIVLSGTGSEMWDAGISLQKTASAGSPIQEFPHDDYPEFQEAVDAAGAELDRDVREGLIQDAIQEWHDASAYLTAYVYYSVFGAGEDVSWPPRRDAHIDFASIEQGA